MEFKLEAAETKVEETSTKKTEANQA